MSYEIRSILYASDLTPRSPAVFLHAVGLAKKFNAKLKIFKEWLTRAMRRPSNVHQWQMETPLLEKPAYSTFSVPH